MNATSGVLYVVATPIGNLEDITLRGLRVLREVDGILAEDTRRSRRLLDAYEIRTPFLPSHYQGVERQRVAGALDLLRSGRNLALISDAGTPLLCDPGFPLVRAAREAGIPVVPVPGASALLAALAVAGFPLDRFVFDGVPPKKAGARAAYFAGLADETRTVAVYESAHRIAQTLETVAEELPARELALCRELTKVHEEVLQGTAAELLAALRARPAIRGEFVLLVRGADAPSAPGDPRPAAEQVAERVAAGEDRKAAIKAVAQRLGVSKREVFDAVVRAKRTDG